MWFGDEFGMSVVVKLYDSLSRRKVSLKGPVVKAYFCGPTVYDVPHLGHARAYVVFDVLVRLLRYLSFDVKYVRNITDVDDKIIRRAWEENASPFEIAEKYYYEFYDAMKKLKVLPPNIEPRASGHIPEIIEFVSRLIEKGYAYETEDGVYFRVHKFKEYGKLSKRSIESMIAGARVEPSPFKEDPLDFALWKKAKPGEPFWQSPWGPGRPGWHIECSAMVLKHLGETIDIHGGGEDLIFPHHENEIAQSEALTGKPFARIWFHVGLLIIGKEKMAKSLGNIVSVKEALKRYDAETIRYYLLSVHYRKQLLFDWSMVDEAEKKLDELYRAVFAAEFHLKNVKQIEEKDINMDIHEKLELLKSKFLNALADNLNTVEAFNVLHDIAKKLSSRYKQMTQDEIRMTVSLMRDLGSILGILEQSLEERIIEKKSRNKNIATFIPPDFTPTEASLVDKLLSIIIYVRSALRQRKIYDLADKIREMLGNIGISLEDTKDATHYRFVRIH